MVWLFVTAPFLALSALAVCWLLLHTPPPGINFPLSKLQSMILDLTLVWSLYPGAVIWTIQFRSAVAKWRSGTLGIRQAIGWFWLNSLAMAPIPVLINFVVLENHPAFAHLGEGTLVIYCLPFVSVGLSSFLSFVLALVLDAKETEKRFAEHSR